MTTGDSSFGAVFTDTCVLLDFVLKQDDGTAKELLVEHTSENVISRTVQREFEGVKNRRKKLVKSVLKAHKKDNLDDWEPPRSIDLSPNDRSYCGEIFSELRDMKSDSDILKFLSEKEREIRRGEDVLLKEPNAVIDTVWNGSRDPGLLSRLRTLVTNGNDRKVICDAADWADENGTDPLVTADYDDIMSVKDEIEDLVDGNRNPSQLNILTKNEFLETSA